MIHRMTLRTLAVIVVIAGIVAAIVVTNFRSDGASSAAAGDPCPPLEPDAARTLQMLLPDEWRIERAAVRDAERTRESDGAPVSFIAAWILDAGGARATDEPAIYVWEGGMLREHEEVPKAHYVLNDAAAQVTYDTSGSGQRADVRRATRDARTLREPYSPDDPAAVAAAACLRDET
jgi:hypothetical protein